MIKKELHLDKKTVFTLEAEAKRQNRSLKNYLEYLAIEQAKRLEVPSKEYIETIDNLLKKLDSDEIEFYTIGEFPDRNGSLN